MEKQSACPELLETDHQPMYERKVQFIEIALEAYMGFINRNYGGGNYELSLD